MSGPRYSIFSARAVFDARLTATDVRVLAALGTYSDKEGWCFPSQALLAERCDVARTTVSGAVQKLEALGYIAIRPRVTSGKGKVGNEYRVILDLPDLDTSPMSPQGDNGVSAAKKTRVAGSGQRKGPKAKPVIETPMSPQSDIGPMSAQDDMPMSAQDDIAKEITIPVEQSHLVLGDFALEPPEPEAAKPKRKAAKPKARKASKYTPEFDAFWMTWPRNRRERSDKPKAFDRWQTAVERWDADRINAAGRRYLASPDTRKENYRFCCLAEVFLNGKLEAAIEAVTPSQADFAEGEQVLMNGQWCWPDGRPVESGRAA